VFSLSNIPESYLPPSSQPWGRWVTNGLREFFRKREEYDMATQNSIRQLNIAIPQPMRGLLVRQTSGTVTITTAGVYVPMNLTSTLDSDVSFNMVASGAPNVTGLKNDTDQTRTVVFIATYDGKGGNNQGIGLKLALNNVPINASECASFAGSSGQFGKAMTQYMMRVAPGDEVTMWAANLDGTTNIDVARLKLLAHAVS
jgi:hypothetical protein